MYKIYQTAYKPFWINSENKISYEYFNQIDFLWIEVNNISVNYVSEDTVSLAVENLDTVYYKIEELNEDNSIKNTSYFYFNSVIRRMTKGYIISCKLDYWATFNILVEKKLIENDKVVKFRRAHLKLNDFRQYPVFVDSLLNSINDWKSKNNPKFSYWKEIILKPGVGKLYSNKNSNPPVVEIIEALDSKIYVDFAGFYQKNYIFNKYFVVDNEGEYWLFPDFSYNESIPNDLIVETNKEGIANNYAFYNTDTQQGAVYQGEKTELNLMRIKSKFIDRTNNVSKDLIFCKLNTKSDMDYLINNSKFAAKKNVGYYFGPNLFDLLDRAKFDLSWGVWSEETATTKKVRNLFFVKLPFEGKKVLNLFDNVINSNQTITNNLNTPSYLTDSERDIIIGNTILKHKQLINNDYLLRFDNSGFKLFPINQTNIDLFRVIEYGDLLPTQKDLYLEYIASVRNSVNTGYWTNYAQKYFQIGQKTANGLFNSALNQNTNSAINTVFNTVSNAVGLEFNNSLLIANMKAKYADMKNSIGINPQTYNVENQNFYLIPQNWLTNNFNNLTPGNVVSYEYSIMDWLETTIVDINNLFLFYGFELNNSYNYTKVANQDSFYFVQIDSEYLAREINFLYPINVDYQLKINAINEFTSGVRIFKKQPTEVNTKWIIT